MSAAFAARQTLGFGAKFISRSDVNADHKAAALRQAAGQ